MRPSEYLGDATFEKMKKTKWYALARFIDELLYAGSVREVDVGGLKSKRFVSSERVYMGNGRMADWVKILGKDGDYLDTEKALREVMLECERMAVKEVT